MKDPNFTDFTLEFNSEQLSKEIEYDLFTEAETHLQKLAAGHSDITGAAINVRKPVHAETAPLYEVTVVVYTRPEHVAATQKEADPRLALKGALSAAERQIRKRRSKLKKHWEQPGNHPVEQEINEIIAAESDESASDTTNE